MWFCGFKGITYDMKSSWMPQSESTPLNTHELKHFQGSLGGQERHNERDIERDIERESLWKTERYIYIYKERERNERTLGVTWPLKSQSYPPWCWHLRCIPQCTLTINFLNSKIQSLSFGVLIGQYIFQIFFGGKGDTHHSLLMRRCQYSFNVLGHCPTSFWGTRYAAFWGPDPW